MKRYKVIDLLDEVISGEWGKEPDGENDVKVLRTTNFTNEGRLDLSKEIVIRSIDKKKIEKKKLQYGDIIIEKSGGSPDQPVGRVVYFDIDDNDIYLCNNFTSVLRPNSEMVENKYLLYFLYYQHKIRKVLKYENKTTGIINLKLDNYLKRTDIVLPSRKVQQRLVKLLDKSYELIEKRRAQIEALDHLAQSVFFEMFGDPATNPKGWEYKKLSDICQNLDNKRVPIKASERKKGIYPYYGASGIVDYVNDYIFDGNFLLVSEDGANLLTRVTPIAFEVGGKIWVNNHAHILKFDNLSTQCFIKYVINLQDISHLITGSAQPKLNQKNLNSFKVPVPPLRLQNEFYEKVKLIEGKRKTFHSSLLELEKLFNSLLQKSFRGELFTE